MKNKEQIPVEYILLLILVLPIAGYWLFRGIITLLLVVIVSSPSEGPYGDGETEYKRTSNVYYLPKYELFVEETVIDNFAPMMLQIFHKYPDHSSLDKPAGLLLVDLPSDGGLSYPKYLGNLSEEFDSYRNLKRGGAFLSCVVLVQTPDSSYTNSWFYPSNFIVAPFSTGQKTILYQQLELYKCHHPEAEIIVYPEIRGGLYVLNGDGRWDICLPISTKEDTVKGSYLNRLKKKYFPKNLVKSPSPVKNGKIETFGYTTN